MVSGPFRKLTIRSADAAGRHGHSLPGWLVLLFLSVCVTAAAQSSLPDAPSPQPPLFPRFASGALPAFGGGQNTFPPQGSSRYQLGLPALQPDYVPLPRPCRSNSCSQLYPPRSCCRQTSSTFGEYLRQNQLHIYTPTQLAGMAGRSVVDPFNLLTIGGTSAFSIGTDSHSPFGPGMKGWAKQSGVTLTEDIVAEFFGTFVIPSIDHQDPHYYRMPNASMARRIAHCIYQPYWTVSDTGKGMPNYSNLIGSVVEEAVNTTYVPYRQVGVDASSVRISVNLATMPIGNFITEFVPDVASHININIVFLQRIIDRVAVEEGAGTP